MLEEMLYTIFTMKKLVHFKTLEYQAFSFSFLEHPTFMNMT
jgi:hypothetical protein